MPLGGGTARGPELNGELVAGGGTGSSRADGVLEIAAHYVIRTEDGALVERSDGLRHGPAEVMQRLARGEAVPREAYFFRTLMRFHHRRAVMGAPQQGDGRRGGPARSARVLLDVYRLA